MARISTYTTTEVSSDDKLIGTDVNQENATKNFTVDTLGGFIAENNNDDIDLNGINFRFQWNLKGATSDWHYPSNRYELTDAGNPNFNEDLKVPKLWIIVENLPDGNDYSILIERHKKQSTRSYESQRRGGWKKMDATSMASPFDSRVLQIPITNKDGQFYDFKFDYYYKTINQSSGLNNFPNISGSSKSYTNPGGSTSAQYFAFKLVKGSKVSPIINTLKVIGVLNEGVPRITFSPHSI